MEKYVFISGVCKYHVHQDVWKPLTGEKPLLLNKGLIINIQEFQVAVNTCSEPLIASQVLTIHLQLLERFLWNLPAQKTLQTTLQWNGDSIHTNNNWNAVSQAE